jgi:hypothetical protein
MLHRWLNIRQCSLPGPPREHDIREERRYFMLYFLKVRVDHQGLTHRMNSGIGGKRRPMQH